MNYRKSRINIDFVKKWAKIGINPILLSILNRRGIQEDKELFEFIFPTFENLPSPFLLEDMAKALHKLEELFLYKKKILIFGDRDVDGASSVAMLYEYLKDDGFDVYWQLPIDDQPYGLSRDLISDFKQRGIDLCITVDCGISNHKEIEALKNVGIETIVIDHHEPHSTLPEAFAIINPKCSKNFGFPNLSGSGVTFMFIFAHAFFKSEYFNKKIALLYKADTAYKLEIFVNLLVVSSFEIQQKNLPELDVECLFGYECDLSTLNGLFYKKSYSISFEKNYINSNLLSFFGEEIKARTFFLNKIYETITSILEIKKKYLPLAMLGTIADIMPLIGPNRIISKLGISYLKEEMPKNFEYLFKLINFDCKMMDSKDISWTVCPILNSPGRMGDATKTVNFFLKNSLDSVVEELVFINNERKKKGEEVYQNFLKEIDKNMESYKNSLTFFCSDDIDRGITGITAMRIAKYTNIPSIVVTKEGGCYSGSMRGNGGYHLVKFLEKGKELFVQYGGHKNAAGFRFEINRLNEFKKFLYENLDLLKSNEEEFVISIDAEIPLTCLDLSLFKILSVLEPFGEANESPVFYTSNVKINSFLKIGAAKEHLKLYIATKKGQLTAIFWNKAEWFEAIYNDNTTYNIIYKLELNRFNGSLTPQLVIIDMEKA